MDNTQFKPEVAGQINDMVKTIGHFNLKQGWRNKSPRDYQHARWCWSLRLSSCLPKLSCRGDDRFDPQ